jgi:hypothetical protein
MSAKHGIPASQKAAFFELFVDVGCVQNSQYFQMLLAIERCELGDESLTTGLLQNDRINRIGVQKALRKPQAS